MEFFRKEYWSGLPFSSPGDLPHPGIELPSLIAPALAVGSLPLVSPEKSNLTPLCNKTIMYVSCTNAIQGVVTGTQFYIKEGIRCCAYSHAIGLLLSFPRSSRTPKGWHQFPGLSIRKFSMDLHKFSQITLCLPAENHDWVIV